MLKTYEEVCALLRSMQISYVSDEAVPKFENGNPVFFDGGQHWLSYDMKTEGARKFAAITGKTLSDLDNDLQYHLLDEFESLSTYDAIRERIKDPATCASMATTLAVNKYITTHGLSSTEIKALLAGSKWKWTQAQNGDWQQQTLYADYDGEMTDTRANNGPTQFSTYRLASVKPLFSRIIETARSIHQQREEEQIRRETTLQSYGTRATEFFKFKVGKDAKYRTFLGVELELENHSTEAFKTLNVLKDHAIFKRDGSLNEGVEICTAPATLDIHKEAFKAFFDAFKPNKCALQAKSTCGMHVHIDRSKLSHLHIANLCLLLNNPENENHITPIAGRAPNSYCKTVRHSYHDFTRGNRGDRYQRVNLQPSATIELRLFASTTNYQDFATRLEFTQAVVDYTRPGETNITCKEIPIWSNFKEYVLKHQKAYPFLAKGM